jgi:hypothetical protein
MNDGTEPADFGRYDKIDAQQRDRHFGKVKIELNTRADEKCARQKFTEVPAAPCEIKRRQTEDYQSDEKRDDHVTRGFVATCGSPAMLTVALAIG